MFGSIKTPAFDSNTNADSRSENSFSVEQEWEEAYAQTAEELDDAAADELVEEIEAAEDEGLFLDEESIALAEFPALRMAYEIAEPYSDELGSDQPDADLPEYIAESDGEDGLTQLILRHAQLAELEEAQGQEEPVLPAEDIPELFRIGGESAELTAEPPEAEEPQEEFTMESELQKQRRISGELFDYIDTINSDALDLIRKRDERKAVRSVRPYDPYNMHFNSRYDNREEILEGTPEIELTPKFELKGNHE